MERFREHYLNINQRPTGGMMTNFAIPFALTPTGQVQTTDNPNQIANDRVEALVGTYPGERVMIPDYGVNIPPYVFSPDIPAQQTALTNQIQAAVNQWEPSIHLNDVTPVTTQSDVGIIDVNVEFTLSNNPALTPVQIATVEVGGNVVQN
jgi:phage baseplate assembly protein W